MCRIISILYHEGSFVYYKAKAFGTTGRAGRLLYIKIRLASLVFNLFYKLQFVYFLLLTPSNNLFAIGILFKISVTIGNIIIVPINKII